MKKYLLGLMCCAMLTSARADEEYVTLPVWGPFEEFLTSKFDLYFMVLNQEVRYLGTILQGMQDDGFKEFLKSQFDLYFMVLNQEVRYLGTIVQGMQDEGFNVRILDQDFTELETYLEDAVSSPLNHIYTQLQNGINVHGTLSADLNFSYSKFDDVFSYYAAATGPSRFNLAYHKRYVWGSHIYDPAKPIPEVVSVEEHGATSYDFLGFIEQYCNGQLQNMEQLQAGLVQVVGALRGDDAQTEEITDDFESVESDSASQLSELRNSVDFSKYNLEVSDELFRYEVFAIGNGSTQLPEFVHIGPFEVSMFNSQTPSLQYIIDTREWRPFFELCRSCFTIIIYLVICTLALSICFLLWKVGAPCVRVLQNIFNF